MPHCIVEFSRELIECISIESLMNAVHQGALKSELFSEDDIKARASAFEHVYCKATEKYFVHVTIKVLTGRSIEQRYELSQLILTALAGLSLHSVSLTVDVDEMESNSYAKLIN